LRNENKRDLEAAKLLQNISVELLCEDNIQAFYERVIDTAMEIMHSEYASMQMLHQNQGKGEQLQLLAFRGFNAQAAKFWDWVEVTSGSTCGEALRLRQRVIVPDVKACSFMQGTEDQACYLQTGIHAVQSTPLFTRSGIILGMISTHWSGPYQPSERELNLLDILARQAADLIERKKLEKELEDREELFESVIENMYDAITIYNKVGKIAFMNAEARKLYPHLGSETTVDNAHSTFKYYNLEHDSIPEESLPTRRAFRGEKIRSQRIIIERDGNDQYTEVNSTPIFDNEGNLTFAVISHRDITEYIMNQQILKSHQEQLLKAEKEKIEALEAAIRIKDEFLYLITHEFKTPIAVISSVMQSIDSFLKADVTERMGRYLNMVKMNTNRQLRLVNNLLDITRMNSGNIELNKCKVDILYITKAIVSSVDIYARQKKVSLNLNTSIEKKEIYLDEEKYERIMLNLLSNALKFTPPGKSIHVSLELKKHNRRSFISISVSDEGIGIPIDRQKVIFERFGQADTSLSRQAEGTGLGLYLVTLLVNALGGSISLESEVGKGSTFTVLLPIAKSVLSQEVAACKEENIENEAKDSRIFQAAAIEFSDIYFD